MSLKVRELLYRDDFPQYLDMARMMQAECEPDIPFDEVFLLGHMFHCINDCERKDLNSWIAFRNNEQIGMAVATASPPFFNNVPITVMHYWYVVPMYRKTRAGMELLRHFEKWSRSIGARRMHLGADRIDVAEADVINRMIAKRGFIRYGEQFYKLLGDANAT